MGFSVWSAGASRRREKLWKFSGHFKNMMINHQHFLLAFLDKPIWYDMYVHVYVYIYLHCKYKYVYTYVYIYICTYDIHSKPGLLRTSFGNGNRKVEIEPAHHWWRDLNPHHVVKKEVPFGANLELEVAPIQRQWPLLARDFTVTTEPTDWNFLFHASWPEDTPISFGFWFTNDTTRQVEPAFDILSCEEPG